MSTGQTKYLQHQTSERTISDKLVYECVSHLLIDVLQQRFPPILHLLAVLSILPQVAVSEVSLGVDIVEARL